jgi:hypothetical protein
MRVGLVDGGACWSPRVPVQLLDWCLPLRPVLGGLTLIAAEVSECRWSGGLRGYQCCRVHSCYGCCCVLCAVVCCVLLCAVCCVPCAMCYYWSRWAHPIICPQRSCSLYRTTTAATPGPWAACCLSCWRGGGHLKEKTSPHWCSMCVHSLHVCGRARKQQVLCVCVNVCGLGAVSWSHVACRRRFVLGSIVSREPVVGV